MSYEEPGGPGGPPAVPPPPGWSPPGASAAPTGQPWPVPPPQTRKKRKVWLFVLLAVLGMIVLGVALLGVLYVSEQNQVENSVPSGAEVGDCYAADESLEPVPCEGPHVYEVFSAVIYELDVEYPGRISRSVGNVLCEEDLERFTGANYITGRWDYAEVYPSEDDWNAGNRFVVCALYEGFGTEVVGSARNQG